MKIAEVGATHLRLPEVGFADGYVTVPTAPGLGVGVDPGVMERFQIR